MCWNLVQLFVIIANVAEFTMYVCISCKFCCDQPHLEFQWVQWVALIGVFGCAWDHTGHDCQNWGTHLQEACNTLKLQRCVHKWFLARFVWTPFNTCKCLYRFSEYATVVALRFSICSRMMKWFRFLHMLSECVIEIAWGMHCGRYGRHVNTSFVVERVRCRYVHKHIGFIRLFFCGVLA